MPKIHQLPEQLIAQIAAGEVIERPAYAVKELIENAIDAGADHIQIHLEEAGFKKILVVDNGEGMEKEDVQLCFLHHTTSKIDTSLFGIKTYGFRGEALSSIASISSLTIKSKPKGSTVGTEAHIHHGTLTDLRLTGMPEGTIMSIDGLFSSLPVRKKFLKSPRTELRLTMDVVMQLAIQHPHIRIELTHNGRTLIDFIKHTTAEERVQSFLGRDIFLNMLPVQWKSDHISVYGYISKPHLINSTTNKQYIFVNNRAITDVHISRAVKEAYGRLLDNSSYPMFVLFLTVPHEIVDVNVHPRKEQLAFSNPAFVHTSIKESITQTLQQNNMTYIEHLWDRNNMPSYATQTLRDEVLPWDTITKIMPTAEVMQMHKVYIVVQTYNGILLVDQHAAHERILYEQFVSSFQKKRQQSQKISPKEMTTLHLSPPQMQILEEYTETLAALGFTFEPFGTTEVRLATIPDFFQDHDIPMLIRELLNMYVEGSNATSIDVQSQKMLAFLACRSAIKAGDTISKKQAKELLSQLEKTPNNQTCPHGRPTRIEMSLRSLHKMFKRS